MSIEQDTGAASYFSIRWENLGAVRGSEPNTILVRTTFLDEAGRQHSVRRKYREWMGVCTRHVDRVQRTLETHFPDCRPRFQYAGQKRKVLPYFSQRLTTQRLDSPPKPFYKVFLSVPLEPVGKFLAKYKFSYYEAGDWLVRLYIDLCDTHTEGFFYKWYRVTQDPWLLASFTIDRTRKPLPPFTVAAFDLETVPMDGGQRVPDGHDPTDEIVMISVCLWSTRRPEDVTTWLLYRRVARHAPTVDCEGAVPHDSEKDLLRDFHDKIKDAHVLTGYNICRFDLACIFARLVWLHMYPILGQYTSSQVGEHLVTTFQRKIVLDLYPYFKTHSNYDLTSFKLDEVARIKLGEDERKIPIHATGLWCWYWRPEAAGLLNASVEEAHRVLQPHHVTLAQFGTFQSYMRYCVQDSQLVQKLFEKEMVLLFVVERANFTAGDATRALYLGNSNFLVGLFQTYGTALGFFVNIPFFKSPADDVRQCDAVRGEQRHTYQGALNFCTPEKVYEHVSVMDFTSMYPSTLVSSHLCYSTCTLMSRDAWLACPWAPSLTAIPYREHGEKDFLQPMQVGTRFRYPAFDPAVDAFVIVIHETEDAFLPCIVRHFIALRSHHQAQFRETRDLYHHNAQLNIKILINSLYGVMANPHSVLAHLPIAMSIVTLARYQLLGSFHYIQQCGHRVCYADTDSLMVHGWPDADAARVNAFLGLPHVQLKYEQCMRRLLVLSKKRYVYETQSGAIVTKGFQKRVNDLLHTLTQKVLAEVWSTLFRTHPMSETERRREGWLLWVDVIQGASYMCRDAKKYAITRKTKPLHAYKSTTCATVRMLQRYPDKANDYIDYTYSRADMAVREASKWVLDAEDCQWVNYEQLIMSQKKMFILLLKVAYWNDAVDSRAPSDEKLTKYCDYVMNTLRWKQFVHAELLYGARHAPRRRVHLLVERGCRYTFYVNDCAERASIRLKRGGPSRLPKAARLETRVGSQE